MKDFPVLLLHNLDPAWPSGDREVAVHEADLLAVRRAARPVHPRGEADLLAQHRLVTLTGAGGIGKTHLALRSLLLKNELDLTVTRLVPDIEVQQGTFAFRVAIPPELRNGLVPGAFVTATLTALAGSLPALLVPSLLHKVA